MIQNATGDRYAPPESGTFSVVVTNGYGCYTSSDPYYYEFKTGPQILAKDYLDFDTVWCVSEIIDTVWVGNNGRKPLDVSSAMISGANQDKFEFYPDGTFHRFAVDSGDFHPIIIRYKTDTDGLHEAVLTLLSNSETQNVYEVALRAVRISTKFEVAPASIEFVDVIPYAKEQKTFEIHNTGSLPISWTVPQVLGKFTLLDINPIITLPGETSIATVEFAGDSTGREHFETQIMQDTICFFSQTVKYAAYVSKEPARAVLEIGVAEGKPGDLVNIPVYIRNIENLNLENVQGIITNLRYNATLLYPMDNNSKGEIALAGGFRIDTLVFPKIPEGGGLLGTFPYRVMLGDAVSTVLHLEDYKPIKGYLELSDIPGTFNLKNVCEEGGPRLINSLGGVKLTAIPNPASEYCEIKFSLVESGKTNLYVTNVIGQRVLSLLDSEAKHGDYSILLSTENLQSGVYYIMLETPRRMKSVILQVVK